MALIDYLDHGQRIGDEWCSIRIYYINLGVVEIHITLPLLIAKIKGNKTTGAGGFKR